MISSKLNNKILLDVYEYYKVYTNKNTKYVLLSFREFMDKLIINRVVYYELNNNEIIGFISGVILDKKAFITIIYSNLDNELLVKAIEEKFKENGVSKVLLHFFNPVLLPWYPLEGVVHPGYQGVILNSKVHKYFTKLGYLDNSIQDTYYLDLSSYENRCCNFQSKGIEFGIYDKSIHTGLVEFTNSINTPHWKQAILSNENKDHSLPLLVVTDNLKVIGFTGPLKVSSTQRGYFAGIGILPEYRGRKIGTYLFNQLCSSLQDMGAAYLTLFTGQTNIAKYIYLGAGCSVVESFITLKKSL